MGTIWLTYGRNILLSIGQELCHRGYPPGHLSPWTSARLAPLKSPRVVRVRLAWGSKSTSEILISARASIGIKFRMVVALPVPRGEWRDQIIYAIALLTIFIVERRKQYLVGRYGNLSPLISNYSKLSIEAGETFATIFCDYHIIFNTNASPSFDIPPGSIVNTIPSSKSILLPSTIPGSSWTSRPNP